MQTIIRSLSMGEKVLTVAFFLLMTLAAIFQVVNRNIFHFSIGWSEEVARYCQVWLALLGTQIGLRTGGQMAIEVLTSRLKGGLAKAVAIIADVVILCFCLTVVYYSLDLMLVQIENGQVSSALNIPMTIPYAAMPFCFIVMSLSQLHRLFGRLAGSAASTAVGSHS